MQWLMLQQEQPDDFVIGTGEQYWVRDFVNAAAGEPTASEEALALIGALYRHEEIIQERQLEGDRKLAYRTQHSEPLVRAFRGWYDDHCHRPDLLASSTLAKALNYAMARQVIDLGSLNDLSARIIR